ncbi:GntR family transcriptional regulator [Hydrogenophaga sp. Root209]|uniref:aminotransferase-like domain-containing protein n=1 Tax=Hydrogenophaga sp. Root209 TaxID=1736490 RepID=UPI0006F5B3D2|nr:PLP-dependent aminotransferase family protein [Hydrogenophaga sp. Root209]KRC04557.1 GntR family transcriptional regulator [Hydrogenophaga sp. Root209]
MAHSRSDTATKPAEVRKKKRYQSLADDMAESIRTGVLRPGDRLPSVRNTCVSRGVSPSTVFQAYYLLEARGLIQARERSGYFVSTEARRMAPEPERLSEPRDESLSLDVSKLVFEILDATMKHDVVPFGSAFPSPLHFPLRRLGQALAASAQALDPWSTVDDLTPGNLALRRQIALRYLAAGMHVHADDIVITNGALEALNLCLAAVTRPGDAVVVESPTFYAALQSLERMGLEVVEVPTHPREGIDLLALEHALERHRPKACWLMTNFQNPLGSLMPDYKKRALVDLLARHAVPLIEDDVYGELYFGDHRPAPAKAYDRHGMVLHCSSFSKNLAPGYRIGWAAPGRYTSEVARQKLTSTLSASIPAQLALASYLERGGFDKHLRKLRHALGTQRDVLAQAVGHFFPTGTKATRPMGGYFLWVELPESCDALTIHRQALELGVSCAPGPIFSSSRAFSNCIRLNYGHYWDARAEDGVAILGRLARRQCER